MRNVITPLIISMALAGAVACAGSVRVYDGPHRDYHRWNRHEEVVYRGYMTTNHRPYVEFNTLSAQDQNAYWDWRHHH